MRQIRRTRTATKQVEHTTEETAEAVERDEHADAVVEDADCCIANIDAEVDEACCLLAESADMLADSTDVVEAAPADEEFQAEYLRLRLIYWDAPERTAEETEAWNALQDYRAKWPQFDHLCTC